MKNLKYYLNKAQNEHWAVPQFNFSTLEQLKGIVLAAEKLKSPVIVGTSEGEAKYIGLQEAVSLVNIAKWKHGITAILHLDHARDFSIIKDAIDFGYDSVHFDGSLLKFKDNISQTRKVIQYAKKNNVFVEGEIDSILGESKFHSKTIKVEKKYFTDPLRVRDFSLETGINSLAISIGSFHGIWAQEKKIDFSLLEKIKKETNSFLVLHGGSDVSAQNLKKAIKLGIVKVNFNTELRVAWKNSLYKSLGNKTEFKPYSILPKTVKAIQKIAETKIALLGSKNKL